MMNPTKLLLVMLIIFGLIFSPLAVVQAQKEPSGKQIIDSFIKAKGMDIQLGTDEYKRTMKGILLGEYPELTGKGSSFIRSTEELGLVLAYAGEHSGYNELGEYRELDVQEAQPVLTDIGQQLQATTTSSLSDSRYRAVNYAYSWSISGGISRNPDYPDFGFDDCTNFVSQAMKAGGFMEKGSGDGCEYEVTSTEWYVDPNPSPPLWCVGSTRYWEWSTSWSVPWPFRDYFVYQNVYANEHGWTISVATAKYYLSSGDVVQLQKTNASGDWETYHTMIVTDEDSNDLYVTYHSNGGGFDEVDKPLSSIPTDINSHRYLLVAILFPEVYLPVVRSSGSSTANQGNNLSQNPYPSPLAPEAIFPVILPYPAP